MISVVVHTEYNERIEITKDADDEFVMQFFTLEGKPNDFLNALTRVDLAELIDAITLIAVEE